MKRLHFILSIFVVLGLMFELFPDQAIDAPRHDFWLLFDPISNGQNWGGLTWQQYAYYSWEHIRIILLAVALIDLSKNDNAVRWFMRTEVAQLADFWLTYNTTWFHIGVLPVTMNIVQIVVLATVILKEVYHDRVSN